MATSSKTKTDSSGNAKQKIMKPLLTNDNKIKDFEEGKHRIQRFSERAVKEGLLERVAQRLETVNS